MNTHHWPFLSVRYLQLHARTDCATDSTLPLATSTQSADRAADFTEVCRCFIYVTVSGLIGLIAAEIWGDVRKLMWCVLCLRCILRILHIVCTIGILHIVCICIYCTHCTYCIYCAYCIYSTHYIYNSKCTYYIYCT